MKAGMTRNTTFSLSTLEALRHAETACSQNTTYNQHREEEEEASRTVKQLESRWDKMLLRIPVCVVGDIGVFKMALCET